MVVIEFGGSQATLIGRRWQCEVEAFQTLLQSDADRADVPTEEPFPELTIAQAAVDAYGGTIIQAEPPVTEDGVIY